MNRDFRRYAPWGLGLAALAALAFLILLLVRGLSAANLVTLPDVVLLDRLTLTALALFVLGLALTALLNPEGVRQFFTGRQAQYGSNAIVMLLAFVGILFFLNALVYANPKTWDLTEDKTNTLRPETLAALQKLEQPVHARAYFSSRADKGGAQKLLENFKSNSGGKFTFEFLDPEVNAVAAKADGVEADGTIILLMGQSREVVEFASETQMLSALLRMLSPETRVLYFLTGHGEADLENPGSDTSYTSLKNSLENKNYTVKSLDLFSEGKVPFDATVVISAGGKKPISEAEAQALKEFLDRGGSLVILSEPAVLTDFGASADPLAALAAEWGLSLENNLIVDPNVQPASFAAADPLNYGASPITENLRGLRTYFPTARSITLGEAPQGITLTALAQTSPNAWGETDMASVQNNSVQQDATDQPGPLTLAASAENAQTGARLVLMGDFEQAVDNLYTQGNGLFLANALDWAAKKDKLIDTTPQNTTQRTYQPPSTLGLIGIVVLSLCLIPLLVLGGGIVAWVNRRKRG